LGGKKLRVGEYIKRKKSAKQGDGSEQRARTTAWELEAGDILVRDEHEVASVEHFGRKALHEGVGLKMEVAKHLVRAPSADEADDVGVDMGTE
jgi:hypothetical protein